MRPLALLALLLSFGSTVAAQDPRHDRAAELAAEARTAFDAGDAEGAEVLLEEALLQVDDPALYYNLARTREYLEDWEGAASAYRAFVARRPDDPRVASVEERMRLLDERLAADREAAREEADERAARDAEPEPEPEPEPGPEPLAAPVEPELSGGGPAGWTWGLMGAGVAVLGAGVGFGLAANAREEDARDAETGAAGTDALDAARRNARIADIAFALGGALAIGGVVAAIVTWGSVSLSPTVGGARLDLRLAF